MGLTAIMFLECPLTGWGASQVETELAHRIEGFRGDVFVVHNTYLEILLEYGLVGFALSASIWWMLLRVHKSDDQLNCRESLLTSLHGPLWPLLLTVYLLNGCFVIMNYQLMIQPFSGLSIILILHCLAALCHIGPQSNVGENVGGH